MNQHFFFIESNCTPNALEEHFIIFPGQFISYLLVSLMYVDFLNVGKRHSLLLSIALSFSPIICKTPGLMFNSKESFLDMYYTVRKNSVSISAKSFIPLNTEHLINTRFDLVTVLCLRMERTCAQWHSCFGPNCFQ